MSLKEINFSAKERPTHSRSLENVDAGNIYDFVFVGNIPSDFKSSDLRFYFKEFVEKSAFCCFHYRHRPETQVIQSEKNAENSKQSEGKKTCCCITKIYKKFTTKFIQRYNGNEWRNRNLKFFGSCVCLKRLGESINPDPAAQFLSKGELKNNQHIENQDLCVTDMKNMLEFNPPENVMPNGNVGTTTKFFHQLIRECKMPSSLLRKLDLEFPKSDSRKLYSKVPPVYDKTYFKRQKQATSQSNGASKNNYAHVNTKEERDSDSESLGEDHGAEDWERHEALHDDVDNQARAKERLYEEDLEVKWEKGGSGLVFYTDAFYWNELKGKDFDEDTVDDWDVDFSVYYEDGAGDKSARDLLQMRMEQRRRQGKHDGPAKYSQVRRQEKRNREEMMNSFAQFEKHSKGFGSKILRKQGWEKGSGVGAAETGIVEPISLEGQARGSRTGLGYYGEKLDQTVSLKRKAEKDVYISTIYDAKDGEQLNAMRFNGQELLKYRPVAVKFSNAKES